MKILFTIGIIVLSFKSSAQLIMVVEMKEPLEGICNNDKVYALYGGFDGQIPPKCPLTKEEIQVLLNEKVVFLKENPKFKGKGMATVFINCEGEALDWRIEGKITNKELNQQILEVFETLKTWTPGKFHGDYVDASEIISYQIKKGMIILN